MKAGTDRTVPFSGKVRGIQSKAGAEEGACGENKKECRQYQRGLLDASLRDLSCLERSLGGRGYFIVELNFSGFVVAF